MNPFTSKVIVNDMENIFRRDFDWRIFHGKTILITGAYGMLASYICYYFAYLNEYKNISVRILAQGRNKERFFEKYDVLSQHDYFIPLFQSILEPIDIPHDIDYIIHAAGGANPRLFGTNPVEVAEANILGTYYLLKLAKDKRVGGFLYFSSGDVYGRIKDKKLINEDDQGTTDQLSDHACYSESKRMGETLCYAFWSEYKVPTHIARIGHTYSPTMDLDNDPRVFASFMRCVYNGNDIIMLSDGKAKRPFCYIADAVFGYMLILLNGQSGEAYNVCNTHEFLDMRSLAEIMVSLRPELNLQVTFKERDYSDSYVENNDNHDNLPNSEKLEKLGWKCEYSTYEGLRNVLRYLNEKN